MFNYVIIQRYTSACAVLKTGKQSTKILHHLQTHI